MYQKTYQKLIKFWYVFGTINYEEKKESDFMLSIPEDDYKVIDIIENKIEFTNGAEQKEWVDKYDIFTNRNLFKKYNQLERLKEVDKIRKEVLAGEE